MAAADYNLYVEQGATFRFTLIYGRRDGTIDSAGNPVVIPYDLTGCKARMQIRQRRGGLVLIAATTDNGGIAIPDPLNGKLIVTITALSTGNLDMSRARYDLEVHYPSGDVIRVMQGAVKISANITQSADTDNVDVDPAALDIDEQAVTRDNFDGTIYTT